MAPPPPPRALPAPLRCLIGAAHVGLVVAVAAGCCAVVGAALVAPAVVLAPVVGVLVVGSLLTERGQACR